MLKIIVPASEHFNDSTGEFISSREQVLQLEHSLVSISKWESKWCKPFLTKGNKTVQETIDYVACMTLTQNVPPHIYNSLTNANIDEVTKYIDAEMTATTFSDTKKTINREVITAEIIYYWMIALNIPFECQKWHLNRLLTLINVCNIKNQPRKKSNQKELMNRNAALNAARRRAHNTKG